MNFEWIEVYNPNNVAIYISKWSIEDLEEKDSITPDDGESITEVVDTNLPSAGISAILLSTCLALFYVNNNRKKC